MYKPKRSIGVTNRCDVSLPTMFTIATEISRNFVVSNPTYENCTSNTPYSKMAAALCAYKLALVASFKMKYSFKF